MNVKRQLDKDMAEAYRDDWSFGRVAAGILLALALLALFIYRAATTDPLWDVENAAAQEQHASSN